jgi:hypothetical protein
MIRVKAGGRMHFGPHGIRARRPFRSWWGLFTADLASATALALCGRVSLFLFVSHQVHFAGLQGEDSAHYLEPAGFHCFRKDGTGGS